MLTGSDKSISRARSLRKTMSLPERLLWQRLKCNALGCRVRRQHPSGPYIADFYCHDARMIIEIDGADHDGEERQERDRGRDAWFAARGIEVLRLPAALVLADIDAALFAIEAKVGARIGR